MSINKRKKHRETAWRGRDSDHAVFSGYPLWNHFHGQSHLDQQIVGTWTLVSVADVRQDGTRVYRLGPDPKGSVMFDQNGRYVLLIVRADLPKFASFAVGHGLMFQAR